MNPDWTLPSIRAEALRILSEALRGAKRVALLNFPNHGNPGDPAIWLGTERLLKELGVKIAYRASPWDTDFHALRQKVSNSPVLLQGGGNLGDLYRWQQDIRERALKELPKNPIIQMPQSVNFLDPENAAKFAELCRAHGDFRLLVRENRSVTLAREQLGIEPLLSPDHAWAISAPRRRRSPSIKILWLGRRDAERVPFWEPDGDQVTHYDWFSQEIQDHWGSAFSTWPEPERRHFDLRGQLAIAVNQLGRNHYPAGAPLARTLHPIFAQTYDPLARRWVARGFQAIQEAKVVVTDRLHGHVFCVLAGIPHVVLDNNYHKVSSTLDTWSGNLPGVHRAESGEQAWEIARDLLAAGGDNGIS
ncbi:MAG: polysaccharide pyruvyl transferase family protein [Promicromonosporaceae bacterium]|nr:polysaccharide pyruvyl transferase family protein [Promicromonosporaceae bacterium]